MKPHDIDAYGVVSSSTLYRLANDFPAAEGYAEIADVLHMTGGEATNSSIVLSRLGASVKLDGNWLGASKSGERTKAFLSNYGIDTSRLPLRENCEGVQEVVFAAGGTRTIFGTYVRMHKEASWNTPQAEDVVGAKVVCLDPFFEQQAALVASIAFEAGIPVVTVDTRYDNPLLAHTSAVVVADSFIRENYPEANLEDLFRQYQSTTAGLVVFTFGDAPIWYARPGEALKRASPFAIDPVDTTGGGDSFRAGIVYGFLNGWDDDTMVEFAAAVAAIVCTRFPGVLNAPTLEEVSALIETARTANP